MTDLIGNVSAEVARLKVSQLGSLDDILKRLNESFAEDATGVVNLFNAARLNQIYVSAEFLFGDLCDVVKPYEIAGCKDDAVTLRIVPGDGVVVEKEYIHIFKDICRLSDEVEILLDRASMYGGSFAEISFIVHDVYVQEEYQ